MSKQLGFNFTSTGQRATMPQFEPIQPVKLAPTPGDRLKGMIQKAKAERYLYPDIEVIDLDNYYAESHEDGIECLICGYLIKRKFDEACRNDDNEVICLGCFERRYQTEKFEVTAQWVHENRDRLDQDWTIYYLV